MAEKDKIEDDDFDIVEEGDEAPGEVKEEAAKPSSAAKEDDDEDDDDEPAAAGEAEVKPDANADAALEEKRARRREEKRIQRENKRRYISDLEEQVAKLTEVTQKLSTRQSTFERGTAETQLRSMERRYKLVQNEIAEAVSNGDGQRVIELMGERDSIRSSHGRALDEYKRGRAAEQQPQRKEPDPRVKSRAMEWASANSWYDPKGKDADSIKVSEIDLDIANSGISPSSSLYWKMLDERVRAELPHKFKPAPQPAGRQSPPVSNGKTSVAKGGVVKITPERKKVLQQMGVWGDKEAMKPYLRSYAKYDAENKTR